MRGARWLVPTCVGLWLGACGSDDPPPPAGASNGGSNSAGASSRGGEEQSSGTKGTAEPGVGGSPGQGGAAIEPLPIGQLGGASLGEPIAGAPAVEPALCDPDATWGSPAALSGVSTDDADERLLAMTYDETTLVFTRDAALLLAERTAPGATFATPQPLTLPAGYTAARGLALGADGLSLVIVSEDGSSFAELSRVARGNPFDDEPHSERFAAINDAVTFSGAELTSPVLSEDGKSFFYAERSDERSDVWRATGAQLEERTRLDPVTLGADDGQAKLPLSISPDERTLFVLDEALGHVVGLWSATPAAELTQAVQLSGLESAFMNEGCSRLYGSRVLATSLDVVIETPR